ncbi:MAG: 50S ribosomal protein L32 [Candidatus Daviesbacteria bacterium]|nr:50S ribosomal protein L32 [Candidatus Daviesbacteria bacterium]
MSQEPKRRHSKARKRVRRASIMLKSMALFPCKNCGKPSLPHIVCKECGFYNGQAVDKKAIVTKA